MEKHYKVVIIGSGPGGYVSAIRAAQLGLSVCLVEQDVLGGVCLNWGCIPTKSLLHSAHMFRAFNTAALFGIRAENITLDFAQVQQRKAAVVAQLRKGIESILKKRGVDVVYGRGRISGEHTVSVDDQTTEFEHCILATGSRAAELPDIKIDEEGIVSNKGILGIQKIPARLIIIGGGVIGCEFADMFQSCGTQVTMIELTGSLLPGEDPDCVRMITGDFKKRGISVMTETRVNSVLKQADGTFSAVLSSGQSCCADIILVAVGRRPNIEQCGIQETGITCVQGKISVDEHMRTSIPGIYAIGDAVGKTFLAHTASHEGITAVEHIAGNNSGMRYDCIPRCVYTHMQVAGVGISESQAQDKGIKVKIGKFPFTASGKALIEGAAQGMIKIITQSDTDTIIGASLCGLNVTELVHELCVAIRAGVTSAQLANIIHAHPTLSESVMEAAESVHGKAIHIF